MKISLNISQADALQKLNSAIRTDYSPMRLLYGFGWFIDEVMYGKIDDNEFWLYDRSAFKINEIVSCTGQITGAVSTENGKTVIDYNFGYTKYNYFFFALIYLGCVLLSLFSAGKVIFIGLTLTWAVAISLTMGLGKLNGKKYKERTISNFLKIFDDCIDCVYPD